ncbi:VOC family protein [Albidovulum sp.]
MPTGLPCWYELVTTAPDEAASFYSRLLRWKVADAGIAGFDYRGARAGEDAVAGIMAAPEGMAPQWSFYVAVADCDAMAQAILAAGGAILHGPQDVPGTGRFAVAADPQGAVFAIIRLIRDDSAAFDPSGAGHGCWHELMTSDPHAAMEFYGRLFGWTLGETLNMGPDMDYHIFRHGETSIGGMMRQMPNMPGPGKPFWLPYFRSDGLKLAIARAKRAGGSVLFAPKAVPGGFITLGHDPQGALFALFGEK